MKLTNLSGDEFDVKVGDIVRINTTFLKDDNVFVEKSIFEGDLAFIISIDDEDRCTIKNYDWGTITIQFHKDYLNLWDNIANNTGNNFDYMITDEEIILGDRYQLLTNDKYKFFNDKGIQY